MKIISKTRVESSKIDVQKFLDYLLAHKVLYSPFYTARIDEKIGKIEIETENGTFRINIARVGGKWRIETPAEEDFLRTIITGKVPARMKNILGVEKDTLKIMNFTVKGHLDGRAIKTGAGIVPKNYSRGNAYVFPHRTATLEVKPCKNGLYAVRIHTPQKTFSFPATPEMLTEVVRALRKGDTKKALSPAAPALPPENVESIYTLETCSKRYFIRISYPDRRGVITATIKNHYIKYQGFPLPDGLYNMKILIDYTGEPITDKVPPLIKATRKRHTYPPLKNYELITVTPKKFRVRINGYELGRDEKGYFITIDEKKHYISLPLWDHIIQETPEKDEVETILFML